MKLRVHVSPPAIAALVLALLLPQIAPAEPCPLAGAFQRVVYDVLGRPRAEQSGSFGLALVGRRDGQVMTEEYVQADQDIYPASTIKTLISLAVLRRVSAGALSLDQAVAISQVNAAQECRHWGCATYGPDRSRTVRQLLTDAITVSNNIAANQLIDLATKDFINQTADQLGAPGLRVFRKVYDDVDPEPQIKTPNRATARALVRLYWQVVFDPGHLLSDPMRAFLVDTLGHQTINGSLNRNFPPFVHFFHKTGNTSRVTGDGGFYLLNQDTLVILVGLQAFTGFQPCPGCAVLSGFQSLGLIGQRALALTQSAVCPR